MKRVFSVLAAFLALTGIGHAATVTNKGSDTVVLVVVENGKRIVRLVRWGLVPAWSEAPTNRFAALNARAEAIERTPMFAEAFRQRRGLVPADGYVEWVNVFGKWLCKCFRRRLAALGLKKCSVGAAPGRENGGFRGGRFLLYIHPQCGRTA